MVEPAKITKWIIIFSTNGGWIWHFKILDAFLFQLDSKNVAKVAKEFHEVLQLRPFFEV